MSGDSIRVVVVIPRSSRELHAELAAIPPRYRAERLRTLATLGCSAQSVGLPPGAGKHEGMPVTNEDQVEVPEIGESESSSTVATTGTPSVGKVLLGSLTDLDEGEG